MENIVKIPVEISNIIPKFDGDEKLLSLFISKCEYVIQMCVVEGNSAQDLYVFHVITSKLTGQAARLISERQDLNTWSSLKSALEQHFGDPRSEECIAIELETLKINSNESYLDFCNRIQYIKSTLIAKVNLLTNNSLRESKIIIYNNLAMNVFLYNLPEDLLRIVRLKACSSLENSLSIVLEEVNFMHQYNSRNKMLKQPHSNTMTSSNPYLQSTYMKPFFNTIKPNNNNPNPLQQKTQPQPLHKHHQFQSINPQQPPKFKFGINPSKQIKLPVQNKFGYKPQFNQNQFGYRPQFNQNQGQQPFGYRPQRQINNNDVSMRTAPQNKPPGFRLNEHIVEQIDTGNENNYYDYTDFTDENEYNQPGEQNENDNMSHPGNIEFSENIEQFENFHMDTLHLIQR